MKEKMINFLNDYSLIYIIGYNLVTKDFFDFGDKYKLDNISLTKTLFVDEEHVIDLNNSIRDQILPQAWKQGRVKCIVSKPTEDYILGTFYHEDRPIQESVRFGKEINEKLIEMFEKQ